MPETVTELWNFITDKWFALDKLLVSKGISLLTVILILALIIFAVALFRFLRKLRKRGKISLLVSKGEIRQGRDFKPVLSLRLSNLNRMPLQVLEISLDSDSMPMPEIIEVAELVGPDEVKPIEVQFEENIVGEEGVLHLFAYLPKQANQLYRLKANFSFEPWAGRYKISPFKQQIKKVRQLDSELLSKTKSSPLNQKLLERSRTAIEPIREQTEALKAEKLEPRPKAIKEERAARPAAKIKSRVETIKKEVIEDEAAQLKPKVKKELKFPKDF